MQLHSRVKAVVRASLEELAIPVTVVDHSITIRLDEPFINAVAGDIAGQVLDSMAMATEEREAEASQAWVEQFADEKSAHACEEVQDAEGEVEDETNSGRFALLLHFADFIDDKYSDVAPANGDLVREYIRTIDGE